MTLSNSIGLIISVFIFAIVITVIAIVIYKCYHYLINILNYHRIKKSVNNKFEYKYQKRYLLTKNEWKFYKSLKPIADKYNMIVLSKIRLADLIEVDKSLKNNKNEYYRYFNLIKAKHIDFALAVPDNMKILLLIELDDISHNNQNSKYKDNFINNVCKKCGYKLLRTDNDVLLDEKIKRKLVENTSY